MSRTRKPLVFLLVILAASIVACWKTNLVVAVIAGCHALDAIRTKYPVFSSFVDILEFRISRTAQLRKNKWKNLLSILHRLG
jgi:hypothetical protein